MTQGEISTVVVPPIVVVASEATSPTPNRPGVRDRLGAAAGRVTDTVGSRIGPLFRKDNLPEDRTRFAGEHRGTSAENAGKEVKITGKTETLVLAALRGWIKPCLNDQGLRQEVGDIDRTVYALLTKMAKLEEGGKLDADNFGSVEMDILKLTNTERDALVMTLELLENQMTAIVGMDVLASQGKPVPASRTEAFTRFLAAGRSALGATLRSPGVVRDQAMGLFAAGREWKSSQERAKFVADFQKRFGDTPLGIAIATEGGKNFGYLSAEDQATRLYGLDQARRELTVSLRGTGANDPVLDDQDPTVIEHIQSLLGRAEYGGKGFDQLSIDEQQSLKIEAKMAVMMEHCTAVARKIWQNQHKQVFEKNRFDELDAQIRRFGGTGPTKAEQQIEAKEKVYREKLEQLKVERGKIKSKRGSLSRTRNNLNGKTALLQNAQVRYTTEGDRTVLTKDEVVKARNLERIYGEMQDLQKKNRYRRGRN